MVYSIYVDIVLLGADRSDSPGPGAQSAASIWLNATFPEMEPSRVLLPARDWAPEIPNPFLSSDVVAHPRLRHRGAPVILPEDGRIDGLIKVRLNYSKKVDTQPIGRLQSFPFSKPRSSFARPVETSNVIPTSSTSGYINPMEPVTFLPPDFGRGLKLTPMDEKLFNFCMLIAIFSSTWYADHNSTSYHRNMWCCESHSKRELLPHRYHTDRCR